MTDQTNSVIPNPDPSLATNERLEDTKSQMRREMASNREETRGWIDSLQMLMERRLGHAERQTENVDQAVREKIEGHVKNLETRLAGGDIALTAALQSADKAAQKQADNFAAVLGESKSGMAKQIEGINEKIDDLKERMSESGGRSTGVSHMASMIISALAALAAVVSVAVILMKSAPTPINDTRPQLQRQRI